MKLALLWLVLLAPDVFAGDFVVTKFAASPSKCYVIYGDDCPACDRLKESINTKMIPSGWQIDRQIIYTHYDSDLGKRYADRFQGRIPQTVIVTEGAVKIRIYGFIDASHLATILNFHGNW